MIEDNVQIYESKMKVNISDVFEFTEKTGVKLSEETKYGLVQCYVQDVNGEIPIFWEGLSVFLFCFYSR